MTLALSWCRLALLPCVLALLTAACNEDLDPPWQLDHDRIVAIRAEPPGITSGSSTIDGLLAMKGGATMVAAPEVALVASPQALASALVNDAGTWRVTMPSEDQLVAARMELGLPDGSPVPLLLGVAYRGTELKATKHVMLGVDLANPSVDSATIAPPSHDPMLMKDMPELVVSAAPGAETHFTVELADPEEDDVVWLTSCGTMHDYDLTEAFLTIEPADPTVGELAVVVRDERGGVAWRVWPVRAE